jgi:hypothetical protein
MTAKGTLSPLPILGAAAALLLAGSCGDDIQGPSDEGPDGGPLAESLSSLIVSNPVASSALVAASPTFGGFTSSAEVVFVSLPPGSVPDGETTVIEKRGTEGQAKIPMTDGGFDPVPVAATAGDTLDVRIELASGGAPLLLWMVVPPDIPPVIVRTDPPPKKRDVPLNAVMRVVFSEPIDAATLTDSSVQLLLDGAPVAGALEFGDGLNQTLTFTPDEPLVPEAEYTLLVAAQIRDLDGDPLAETYAATFTTENAPAVLTLPELIVSDARTIGGQTVAYVSLPAGTLPLMVSAQARNVSAGTATLVIPIVAGGLDPAPIWARAGDQLQVWFTDQAGSSSVATIDVPERRPPAVVRIDPPQGQMEVGIERGVTVVFSEPVDPATLTDGLRLLTSDSAVDANVSLLGDPWIAWLQPTADLEPQTTYELRVTTTIGDEQADALAEPVTARFTTGDPGSGWFVLGIPWQTGQTLWHYYHWREAAAGSSFGELPARRLTVSRLSYPQWVLWEIIDVSGQGFVAAFHGAAPVGVVATVETGKWGIPLTKVSARYRVSVTLMDGEQEHWDFDTYRPPCWWENLSWESCGGS